MHGFFSVLLALVQPSSFASSSSLTQMTDGKGVQQGSVSTSNVALNYQSSGILSEGCQNLDADSCYTMSLSSTGESFSANKGASLKMSRQRIEFLTHSGLANVGEQYEYTWLSWVSPDTGTTPNFCHFWQIFTSNYNNYSGPVYSQTSSSGQVMVEYDLQSKNTPVCGVMDFDDYKNKTLSHRLLLTMGDQGTGEFIYQLQDVSSANATTLMYCRSAKWATGNDRTYVKFGFYRAMGKGLTAGEVQVASFYAWPSNDTVYNQARQEVQSFNNDKSLGSSNGFKASSRSGSSSDTDSDSGALSISREGVKRDFFFSILSSLTSCVIILLAFYTIL